MSTDDKIGEELFIVTVRIINRLAAQEAIFRGDIALDINKAEYPLGVGVRQHQCGQAAHGMADEVEALETQLVNQRERRLD